MDATQSLGEIATANPHASAVFLKHRLDFCCGGKQLLGEACRERGLDPEAVLREITSDVVPLESSQQRWDERPLPELIEFILRRYHDTLRSDLPGILLAAEKIARVHGHRPVYPKGLREHLVEMDRDIRGHLMKEETVLFPAILAGHHGGGLHMPVRVMMVEHEDHGANLRHVRELTQDLTPPQKACATWKALYAALIKLERELMEHIHLENNVLFPRALGR